MDIALIEFFHLSYSIVSCGFYSIYSWIEVTLFDQMILEMFTPPDLSVTLRYTTLYGPSSSEVLT